MYAMPVPWLAAFIVAYVNFGTINGDRGETGDSNLGTHFTDDRVETAGAENQDGTAGACKPRNCIRDDYAFATATLRPHARPDTKISVPNAWVLKFVNPEWSYNKDDWKTYELDWSQVNSADTWRREIKKDLKTDHAKWNDKIWLMNWFREHNLKGPEVVWSQYSNSSWHAMQPLRWGNPEHGTSADMNLQEIYINGKFTGIDWYGIRDLNNNYLEKSLQLVQTPSKLMIKLKQFCSEGVGSNIPRGDFVIKASHLSESQGVFVVKDGKLVKDVRRDFIQNINFPCFRACQGSGGSPAQQYSQDASAMERELLLAETRDQVDVMSIFKVFPNIAVHFDMFKAGSLVCGDDGTLAAVQLVMQFQEMIWVAWESARSKIIPRGTLIERIRRSNLEIKVSVGLGFAWGYYYNSVKDSTERLTEEAKNQAYQIAQDAAVQAGVDYCRVDIIVGTEGLTISELTLVPGLNTWTKIPLDAHIAKLVAWHKHDAVRQLH